jgi:hypothetical protein
MKATNLKIWDDKVSKGPGLVIGETKISYDRLRSVTDRTTAIAAGIPETLLDQYEGLTARYCGEEYRHDYEQFVNWLIYRANPKAFDSSPVTRR